MGIREVAELASVSTATVSRVITGAAKVSPAATDRVLRAIQALDFQPDESARALASQKKAKRKANQARVSPSSICIKTFEAIGRRGCS